MTKVWLAGGGKSGLPKAELICAVRYFRLVGMLESMKSIFFSTTFAETSIPAEPHQLESIVRLRHKYFDKDTTAASGHFEGKCD